MSKYNCFTIGVGVGVVIAPLAVKVAAWLLQGLVVAFTPMAAH